MRRIRRTSPKHDDRCTESEHFCPWQGGRSRPSEDGRYSPTPSRGRISHSNADSLFLVLVDHPQLQLVLPLQHFRPRPRRRRPALTHLLRLRHGLQQFRSPVQLHVAGEAKILRLAVNLQIRVCLGNESISEALNALEVSMILSFSL